MEINAEMQANPLEIAFPCILKHTLIGNDKIVNPADHILPLCLSQDNDTKAGGATLVTLFATAKQAISILIVSGSSKHKQRFILSADQFGCRLLECRYRSFFNLHRCLTVAELPA